MFELGSGGIMNVDLSELAPGAYSWTVDGKTADGRNISAAAGASFRVVPQPPLGAPGNLRGVFSEASGTPTATLTWGAVAGANAYMLSLWKRGDAPSDAAAIRQPPLLQQGPLAATRFVIPDLIPYGQGRFIWRVEAVETGGSGTILRRGQSAQGILAVEAAPPPSTEIIP
jgi:hypothetical protein